MAIRAIIQLAHIEAGVTVWTRHATPKPMAHMCLSGPSGKQMWRHIPEPPVAFVLGLHDWDDVPALAKQPDGSPLHVYGGITPDGVDPLLLTSPRTYIGEIGEDGLPVIDDPGGDPLTLAERRALMEDAKVFDVWVNGRCYGHANGTGTDGADFCGVVANADFLDALVAGVDWRDDMQDWSQAPSKYKAGDGAPLLAIDEATRWVEVRAA